MSTAYVVIVVGPLDQPTEEGCSLLDFHSACCFAVGTEKDNPAGVTLKTTSLFSFYRRLLRFDKLSQAC